MTIKYELSKKQDENNKSQILVRVSVSRNFRVGSKTGLYVLPKDWNDKTNSVRKVSKIESVEKQEELIKLRDELAKLESHIEKAIIGERELEMMTDKKDRQEWIDFVIESFYNPCVKLTRIKGLTFDEFAKIYVEVKSKEENWKPAKNSHKNRKKLWEHPSFDKLSAVQSQLHKMNPKLLMDSITGETLDEYQNFLICEGYNNTTIENHMFAFKRILKWADEKGYLKFGSDVMKHKIKKLKIAKPTPFNYLTWKEFLKFYNYKFDELEKDLELARDRFCFCCATSLRHSDLELLKKSHFDDPDNPTSFTIITKKTIDAPTIFLNEYSKSLYMKYKDMKTDKGLLFPRKSNQKMNKCLKKIAHRLEITREVSKTEYCGNDRSDITTKICDIIATHTGRRTFVVHCAEEGWTEEMIRSYTGHEDFEAMRPYFAIGDKKRRMLMESHF
jgi:integrase